MRASGQGKVNEVVLAVLETLYSSMGFRFATVCLRDSRTGQYRARLSFGAHFCDWLRAEVAQMQAELG